MADKINGKNINLVLCWRGLGTPGFASPDWHPSLEPARSLPGHAQSLYPSLAGIPLWRHCTPTNGRLLKFSCRYRRRMGRLLKIGPGYTPRSIFHAVTITVFGSFGWTAYYVPQVKFNHWLLARLVRSHLHWNCQPKVGLQASF